MLPTLLIRGRLGILLASDTTTLAPAALGNKVTLLKAAFSPNEAMLITDPSLVPADFTGSTPLVAGTGSQPENLDPASGDNVVTILAPAGGWLWECTAVLNLPQTIFGFMLINNAGTILLATQRLPVPVTITQVNQAINLGSVEVRIISTPFSSL